MIDTQRGRPIAVQGVEAHQLAIGRLVERVIAQQALGVRDGRLDIAAFLAEADQRGHSGHETLAQAFARRQHPVVVEFGEQITSVKGCRLLQRGQGTRPRDLFPRGPRHPRSRPRRRHAMQHHATARCVRRWPGSRAASGRRRRTVVEQLAEVGLRLGVSGVGPEEEGEALARLGCGAVEQQIGEQRLLARGVERGQGRIVEQQAKATKKIDAEFRKLRARQERSPLWLVPMGLNMLIVGTSMHRVRPRGKRTRCMDVPTIGLLTPTCTRLKARWATGLDARQHDSLIAAIVGQGSVLVNWYFGGRMSCSYARASSASTSLGS